MILAIDLGHEATKVYNGKRYVVFESLLGDVQSTLMRANGQLDQITTADGRWLVGEAARLHSVTKIRGRDERWAFSSGYLALLLYGISEFISPETGSVVIDLVSGLPITDYKRNRQEISKRIVGKHHIERPGRRNLAIDLRNVAFLPQGLAPAKPYMNPKHQVGTIDLGSRTINYLSFARGELIGSQTGSVEQGATPILNDIAARIEEESGRRYHPLEVVEILKGQDARASGEIIDVSRIVDYYKSIYFQSVQTLVSEVWGNATELDYLLVFGGGALLIGDLLEKAYPQAKVLPKPRLASAHALYEHARRIF